MTDDSMLNYAPLTRDEQIKLMTEAEKRRKDRIARWNSDSQRCGADYFRYTICKMSGIDWDNNAVYALTYVETWRDVLKAATGKKKSYIRRKLGRMQKTIDGYNDGKLIQISP